MKKHRPRPPQPTFERKPSNFQRDRSEAQKPVWPAGRAVIGIHSAREAIKVRPNSVKEVWIKDGGDRHADLNFFADWANKERRPIFKKSENVLDRLAPSHQGICVWVSETPELDLASLPDNESNEPIILLALDEISDPHNVGALLRTAWLLGVAGLIVPDHRSAHLTPAVIKVASGGAEHVPLIVSGKLQDDLSILKNKGFWVYGLAGEGASSLFQTRFHEKVVLVVGAEDKGLRTTTRNVCDELIRIPQLDSEASFNASVAGAMALYEIQRQRQNPLK